MKSIIRNSIFMGLFNIFGRASGLIRYVLLVSFLSKEAFGLVTFAFNVGKIGRHFIDGGLDNLLSRDGAREHGKVPSFYINALALKTALSVTFFVGVYFYLDPIRQKTSSEIIIIYIALIGSAMTSLTGVIRSCFTAIERMEYIFYTNMPSRIISLVLLFIALWYAVPLEYAVAAVSFENIIWFFLLGAISLRFFQVSVSQVSLPEIKYMVSESWSLALYGFFNIFYLSLDVLMIESMMESVEAVAPYTYASQLLEGLTLLLTSYFVAVYPTLSRLYVTDFSAYKRLFKQSLIALLAFTIPVSALLGVWSDIWMNLIKETGEVSSSVLRILAVNLNFSMLNTLLIIVFTSCNRQRMLVFFTALAVGVSFFSNWALIHFYQQPGAAAASLFSQAVLFVVMATAAKKIFDLQFPVKLPLSLLGVTILAAVIAEWIPGLPRLAAPALYCVILPVLVVLLGIITPDEFRRILRSIRE